MSDFFKIALGQITVEQESAANLEKCVAWMKKAASEGARLIVFPEGAIARNPADGAWSRKHAEPLDGPFVSGIVAATREIPIAVSCTAHHNDYPDCPLTSGFSFIFKRLRFFAFQRSTLESPSSQKFWMDVWMDNRS